MKKYMIAAFILVMSASFFTAGAAKKDKKKKGADAPVVLNTLTDSVSYAAGYSMTEGLLPYLKQQFHFDDAYMADFVEGFKEAMAGSIDPRQTAKVAGLQIAQTVKDRMLPSVKDDFSAGEDTIKTDLYVSGFSAALLNDSTIFKQGNARQFFEEQRVNIQKKAGEEFLAENAKKDGVKVLPSGLQYKVLTQGSGAIPTSDDEVKVNYEGRLIDGTVFDSSYKRGEPTTFKANQVIKGWTEALTQMPVGSKWELYIPYDLAYGERGAGRDIKPYAALVFTVELLDIVKPEVKEMPDDSKPVVVEESAPKKPVAKKKPATKKK